VVQLVNRLRFSCTYRILSDDGEWRRGVAAGSGGEQWRRAVAAGSDGVASRFIEMRIRI
jgi:hypothetical protein